MPGARSGGSGSDGSNSGRASGDTNGAVTVWEVVSLLGKLLGTVAALKVVLYLLRVCFAMAWKSGGASHSELIHNLRSKCHPRPAWATGKGRAWTLSPPSPVTVRNVRPAPLRRLEGVCARLHQESWTACVCGLLPRDLSLGTVDREGREAKTGAAAGGTGRPLPFRGRGDWVRHRCRGCCWSPRSVRPARGVTSGWGSASLYSW